MARPGPSLHGAFDLLRAAGPSRLLHLKHKLRTVHVGRRGADLLLAMVLHQLGQDTEARIALEALKADAGARLVARQLAGGDGAEDPQDAVDVCLAVARLYHLLAQENLCPASLWDEAYRSAHRALCSGDSPKLAQLQEEAWARCGPGVLGDTGGFQPLCSGEGQLPMSSAPASATRSLPRPIDSPPDWSRGHSLRSSGSPCSLASNLEISQSPTVLCLSLPRTPLGPSKLCGCPPANPVPEPIPAAGQEPEEMSWPPSVDTESPVGPHDDSPGPGVHEAASPQASPGPPDSPETGTHCPVECTDVPTASKSLPAPGTAPPESPGTAAEAGPTSPPQSHPGAPESPAAPPPASAWPRTPGPPSVPPDPPRPTFYNFVVLHARADEHIALRVRDRLEGLGVPGGATFCEDFQLPGRGELQCLQDAIDHSGFVVLLLTPNFDCSLSLHQVNQALVCSLLHQGRQDCVIPFVPLESSGAQPGSDVASLLAGLVLLDERSRVFDKKVANTFRPQRLCARQAAWRREQELRALRERSQRLQAHADYLRSYQAWQSQVDLLQAYLGSHLALGAHDPAQGPWGAPPPLSAWSGCPQPPVTARSPLSAGPPQTSAGPPQTPGFQPLIIHHAQMVQLGLNNHMWNQRGAQEPEDRAQEAQRVTDQG